MPPQPFQVYPQLFVDHASNENQRDQAYAQRWSEESKAAALVALYERLGTGVLVSSPV
ncbi:hypothetical protein [Halomonas sp. 141]|uniref:hypothetical protein n=1 Tax=Halomonas sp. 141 TaxID=2056666 RepID=UPI0012FDE475|nr:hypothetical protein [Halomonas sp. 141]